jgi:PIN like domain
MGASPPGGVATFYIDASIPLAVRLAVASVRDDVLYAGGPDAPAEDADDDVWLPIAGAADWVVIHRDKKLRKRAVERRALLNSGVRTFCLTSAGSYTRWETLRLLAHRWPDIDRIAGERNGPYIEAVTWQGTRPLTIPGASD